MEAVLAVSWKPFLQYSIGIFREIVSYQKDKKWASSVFWPIFFIVCALGSSFLTRKGAYSFLPGIASSLSVICFWKDSTGKSRLWALPVAACMILYSALSGSILGVVNECLTIASVIVGMIRHGRTKA